MARVVCGNVIHLSGGDYCLLGGKCDLCKKLKRNIKVIEILQKDIGKFERKEIDQ